MTTFGQLVAAYREAAVAERIRNDRPGERTVENVLCSTAAVMRTLTGSARRGPIDGQEEWLNLPVSWLTRGRIAQFMVKAAARLAPISIHGYVEGLRGVTAKWALDFYRDTGLEDIRPFELPAMRKRVQRYGRPGQGRLALVKEWVASLAGEDWMAATLMLEFAMRNGDVRRLKWENFRERKDGSFVLCYQPHKTANSSGRTVAWPVHPSLWARFEECRGASSARVVKHPDSVFARLNADLRKREIFTGSKALYELRKICIDHVYQRYGAEMASSISGDDIRTVTRYYADPSQVRVENVRIADMIGG